ncbi:uncharacterized protein LOC134227461 [Armigeres subalbatus]|uniref:uncharacterized protein LOC134227461 n=1 Tax=Armigeres subalbatus TaxID=124917 RepID=UPI002ED612BA
MGKVAFSSHEKSKVHQHQQRIRCTNLQMNGFIKPVNNVPNAQSASVSIVEAQTATPPTNQMSSASPSESTALKKFLLKDNVVIAEILWALEAIHTHKSYRSAGTDTVLFKRMFPDSDIAAKMEMGRTKVGYLLTYGIAPYYTKELMSALEECVEFAIGFDETLNKISQRQQMDIGVRFWNRISGQVESRYLGSAFLSSTKAKDLVDGIKERFSSIIWITQENDSVVYGRAQRKLEGSERFAR